MHISSLEREVALSTGDAISRCHTDFRWGMGKCVLKKSSFISRWLATMEVFVV